MEIVLWNTEIHKLFVVCNSKNQFNSSDRLGNAAVPNDNNPKFLSHFAKSNHA